MGPQGLIQLRGGLWAYAKFRAIAAQAEMGMVAKRGHAYAPWGGLPPPGTAPAAARPSRIPAAPFPPLGSTKKRSPNAPRRFAWIRAMPGPT